MLSHSGHSCSLCGQRRPLPPAGGGAAQDGGGAGLQRDGRQGAELAHLHFPHHPRGRGRAARRPEARRSAPVRQRRGRRGQSALVHHLCLPLILHRVHHLFHHHFSSFSLPSFHFNPVLLLLNQLSLPLPAFLPLPHQTLSPNPPPSPLSPPFLLFSTPASPPPLTSLRPRPPLHPFSSYSSFPSLFSFISSFFSFSLSSSDFSSSSCYFSCSVSSLHFSFLLFTSYSSSTPSSSSTPTSSSCLSPSSLPFPLFLYLLSP